MIEIDVTKILHSPEGQLVLTVQCKISAKQLVAFYGASGVGKTSTLRMISGLMQPDSGRIVVDGITWFDAQENINLSPQQRQLGVVFQDYALFPNMTVQENLVFALTEKQNPKAIHDLVEIMELGELKNRMPVTLSGGQKQRVALARALVQTPKILLLDEPLAALDNKIRLKLQDYLLKVHREYGLTTILVSHNIGEIIKLSDYLFILQNGKIARQGSPTEIFIGDTIPDGFKLIGNVLKKEKDGEVPIILILVQGNVIPIHVSLSKLSDYNIGDQVVVFFKTLQDAIICKL